MSEVTLTDAGGIGETTADNLVDALGSVEVALDAAVSVPEWVRENVAGIGEVNLSNLQEYARQHKHKPSDNGHFNLDGGTLEWYDTTYRPVGMTTDLRVLFYSGYYQGGSYKTQISRQTYTKDKVNKYVWAFWSWSERDFVPLPHDASPSRLGDQKVADIVDDHEWEKFSEWGLVEYQRGRNYELSDWPDNAEGETYHVRASNYGSDLDRTLRSMELVGITKDRIAVYNQNGTLRKFVKFPDGSFYQLRGNTRFKTDRDLSLGEFGSVEAFVKKFAENDEWKSYAGKPYVADKYKKYL